MRQHMPYQNHLGRIVNLDDQSIVIAFNVEYRMPSNRISRWKLFSHIHNALPFRLLSNPIPKVQSGR